MDNAYAHAPAVAMWLFFGLPLLGLGYFLWLRRRMTWQAVPAPPTLALFVVFASYGTLLELLVTALGRLPWSGLHSLGVFGSIGVLSWTLPVWGFQLHKTDSFSTYHRFTSKLLRYYPIGLTLVGLGVFVALRE